jgi:hypothetical protein
MARKPAPPKPPSDLSLDPLGGSVFNLPAPKPPKEIATPAVLSLGTKGGKLTKKATYVKTPRKKKGRKGRKKKGRHHHKGRKGRKGRKGSRLRSTRLHRLGARGNIFKFQGMGNIFGFQSMSGLFTFKPLFGGIHALGSIFPFSIPKPIGFKGKKGRHKKGRHHHKRKGRHHKGKKGKKGKKPKQPKKLPLIQLSKTGGTNLNVKPGTSGTKTTTARSGSSRTVKAMQDLNKFNRLFTKGHAHEERFRFRREIFDQHRSARNGTERFRFRRNL